MNSGEGAGGGGPIRGGKGTRGGIRVEGGQARGTEITRETEKLNKTGVNKACFLKSGMM